MISSMTGFARTETPTTQGQLLWEVRSVNHRYLEVQIKLPDFCRGLEAELKQLATQQLGRGRVEASLSLRSGTGSTPPTRLNTALVRQLAAHLSILAGELEKPAPVSPLEVLRWPGILEQAEQDPATLLPLVLQTFDTLIGDLNGARSQEGARLQEFLERRLNAIEDQVTGVMQRLPVVLERSRERLTERVTSLIETADSQRIAQEIVLLAQKLDVSEELDRLTAHLAEFRNNLKSGGPVGRRLDFLVQELNREANTLASKSADTTTTRHAVDIKVLIEQIREQIQNVE